VLGLEVLRLESDFSLMKDSDVFASHDMYRVVVGDSEDH
jgi:hypothetical protein